MGLSKYVKKYKTYERGVLSRRAVNRAELQKIKTAQRQAYLKEAQEQARLRGIRIAKAKYNRPSFSQSLRNVVKPVANKPITKKVVKRKIKRRRKPTKSRVVYRYIERR